ENNKKTYSDMKKEDGVLDSYESESDTHEFVVEFKSFEQIIQLAKIYANDTGLSSLYQMDEKYYIEFFLLNDELSPRTPKEEQAIVLEYGEESQINSDILRSEERRVGKEGRSQQ